MRRWQSTLVGVTLLAAACGGSGADEQTAAPATTAAASTTVALPEDQTGGFQSSTILTGAFTTVDGASFELDSVRNQDLVVWFWAPW